MGLLDLFRRKKEKKSEATKTLSELEQLCQNDKETYEALKDTMFLDPRKIETSIEEAVKKAKKFEQAKELLEANLWYRIAGGLAIYKGDVKKVKEYFGKCAKISGKKFLILNNTKKAVAKAQEYYKKYLTS